MADNVTLNAGSGGAVLATDDVGGVHHQLIKVEFGGADSATAVSASDPLPVTLISEALAGNLDVAVAAALPAGDNNIGNIDVLSVIPGVGATNLGKAEDGTHTSGDVGVMALAVRQDTPGDLSGNDGDYEPLQMSGGRLWVSAAVTTALPAGNNNIGDVDIASLPNEGQQNMAGSISVAIASDQSAIPISDGGNTITVDGTVAVSGTVTVQDNASLVDDAAFTPATSRVVMAGAEFDDTTPDSVDEGDGGALRMSGNRNLYIQLRDAAGNERGAQVNASNALLVTQTGALPSGTNNIGDVDVLTLPALPAGTNNIGDVDVLTLPAIPAGNNNIGDVDIASMANLTESLVDDAAFTPGTSRVLPIGYEFDDSSPDSVDEGDIGAARMSANRNIYTQIRDLSAERSAAVTAANALKVDNSAVTQPISGTITANAGTGSFTAAGDVAHGSGDSGNPVSHGMNARQTWPTAVDDGDRVRMVGDDVGRLINYPFAPRDLLTHNRIALTSTSETTLIAAGGANVFRDLLWLMISNESSSECRVDIRDATGGTVRLSIDLAADGGGAVVNLPAPLKQATANNNWTATLSTGVSTIYVHALSVDQN